MKILQSIIIPTFNRSVTLKRTLETITEMNVDFNKIEIVVVDNGSTNATKEVCSTFVKQHSSLNFNYLYDAEPGLMTGRHLGAQQAKGEFLSFIDDDVELSPNWSTGIIEKFSTNSEISMQTGPNLPKYETYPPYWLDYFWSSTPYGGKQCGSLSLLDLGNAEIEIDAIWVWGLNFSIRKSVYLELSGFHPDTMPKKIQFLQGDGETGLSIKFNENKYKAIYNPELLVYHYVPTFRMTKEYFENRYYFQGVANSFTHIRMQHGLYKKQEIVSSKTPVTKKIKRILKKQLQELVDVKANESTDNEISRLQAHFQQKYSEGYAYHQHHFNTNSMVREWVLKPDYMDYKLPEIK